MKRHRSVVLKRYIGCLVAYTQQVLDIEDLFGTIANCTVDILTVIYKLIQIEVGYGLLKVPLYFFFSIR